MEALILSCGTGGGHNSAGRAVEQELRARGHNVSFLDPYTLRGPRTSSAINKTYISMAQKAPAAFGAVYALGNAYRRLPGKSPVYHANRSMAPVLERYLDTHPCDAIVMTHLFPAEIVTDMKRRGMRVPATYFIATDYTCIPFTEETDCDFYVIPAAPLAEEFAGRGIPADRIVPLGIPVGRKFTQCDREGARSRLGLDPNRLFIFVAGGSIGAGSMSETVGTLYEHLPKAQLTVICGSNAALYEKLRRIHGGRITALEYTSRMADLMAACDIFVSKPGGLSSTEAAAVGTALIHVTPIPGCETRNMEFFAANGMCIPVKRPRRELLAACDRLMNAGERAKMRENQRGNLPQNAAGALCELMEARLAGAK